MNEKELKAKVYKDSYELHQAYHIRKEMLYQEFMDKLEALYEQYNKDLIDLLTK